MNQTSGLRSISLSQCLHELFCNPYAPFFTGSMVLICLVGIVTFAGEALLVEKVDQYKARGGTKDCWGTVDGGVVDSTKPVVQLIGLMRNPDISKAQLTINRLEKLEAEAESALPALEHIAEIHENIPIREYANRAARQIKCGMKHKLNMNP